MKYFLNWVTPCFSTEQFPSGDDALFRVWFSVCHLVGMSSALANPIIYGYFNQVLTQNVELEATVWSLQGFRSAFCKTLSCCVRRNKNQTIETTGQLETKFWGFGQVSPLYYQIWSDMIDVKLIIFSLLLLMLRNIIQCWPWSHVPLSEP